MRLQSAVTEFLANELHLESGLINSDTNFSDLGLDSVRLTDLLTHLQEALGIILPEDRLPQIETVGDLYQLVEEVEVE